MNFTSITEAYQAIYEPVELVEEFLSEEYDGIEELTEDDFSYIAEETIYEVLDEGIEVEELDDIFEAVIMELNPYAPAGSKDARAYQKSTSASKRGAERAAAVSAAKEKVKGAIKSTVKTVKSKALAAKGSAQKTAKGLKQQSHVGVAKYANKHNLVKGAGLKTQSSKGRGELRSAVAKHVASRVKGKIKSAVGKLKQKAASAAVSGYAAARSAKQAASDVKNRAVQSAKNTAAVAKRNVKGAAGAAKAGAKSAVGKAARAVATGAGKVASRLGEEAQQLDEISDRRVQGMLAKRERQDRDSGGISAGYMANRRAQQAAARRNVRTGSNVRVDPILSKEEVDIYDIVLEYLCVEGYAETLEQAEWIMVNELTQEEIDSIIEDYKEFPTAKVTAKAGRLMGSAAGKDDADSKKKEKRGIKMMDTMMQHTPDR